MIYKTTENPIVYFTSNTQCFKPVKVCSSGPDCDQKAALLNGRIICLVDASSSVGPRVAVLTLG